MGTTLKRIKKSYNAVSDCFEYDFENENKKAHEWITIGFNNSGVQFQHRCFPLINAKFLRILILKNICERLRKTASRNEFCKIFILSTPFLQDTSELLIFKKLDIQTFNSKQICSLDQYCWHTIFDELKRRFCFLWSNGSVKVIRKPLMMFSGLPFYS